MPQGLRSSLAVFLLLLLLSSCSHVISEGLRAQAEPPVPEDALFRDPDAFSGRMVILGGTIVETTNTEDGTYVEVVQKPLDYRGRPRETDLSRGRFVIHVGDLLDPQIYAPGREVAVAGPLSGFIEGHLGEMRYAYPLVESRQLHLFGPRQSFPIFFSIGVYKGF